MKASNKSNFKINRSQVLTAAHRRFKKDIKLNPNSFNCLGFHLTNTWAIARLNKINFNNFNFNNFYTENYNKLLFFVNGYIKNIEIAQELTNETFVKFNNSLSIYDSSKSNIITYLHNIGKNLCKSYFNNLNNLQKNHVEKNKINISNYVDETGKEYFNLQSNDIDLHDLQENSELKENIDNNINILDDKYKTISLLYFVKNLKYKEIAEILNLNINTVKSQIKRAKDQLKTNINLVGYLDINNNKSNNNNNKTNQIKRVLSINTLSQLNSIDNDNTLFYEVENDGLYY